MYRETTKEIQVEVEPTYLAEESDPKAYQYVFGYTVHITNRGEAPTRLLSRHWVITDGNGLVHEVKGDGVVGEQPEIKPGESYVYSSYCPLPTPTGNMRGSYLMATSGGEKFEIKIPLFFLRSDLTTYH